jgi:uncharacterized protein
MKKLFPRILKFLIGFYILVCCLLYFFQEKLIFFPQHLDKDFAFEFDQPFQEITIPASDGVLLNGILFKSESPQGLIFYLHGNAGSLNSWGRVAKTYTDLNYDVFMVDYRGYGKSEGKISGEEQFFSDLQICYNLMKTLYEEKKIIVLGYSIGTGPAAKIACGNSPGLLILQAPYYTLTDMMNHYYHILPSFILRYKFSTFEYLNKCSMPVCIFHGDKDEVIYYESSVKLSTPLRSNVRLITLRGQQHNGMTDNPEYMDAIKEILQTQNH